VPYEIETRRTADKFLDKMAKVQPRDAEATEDGHRTSGRSRGLASRRRIRRQL